jgi:hypothetical protein
MGTKLWRYKYNYAVKAFAGYLVYQEYMHYKHLSDVAIMPIDEDLAFIVRTTGKAGAFGALCMLI